MHRSSARMPPSDESVPRPHRWVAAALIDVGRGTHDARAERVARTGRCVVPADAWLEVLEVYCGSCRAPYSRPLATTHCPQLLRERVHRDRTAAVAN